ncbi:iron dicitrate transport regulator FecR [Bordetella genomosp. 5]|uniref:FecR family protein n=1 Tax=Bordetella genomosp. 5 TaxID=1395608 RepID=UPI000B9E5E4D|nr:FecR domain-containing protein [Bordetella genomosp. 5]OZI44621.1 iron dicitrate transport regulator FecR [Bordetella genomosp. 5]
MSAVPAAPRHALTRPQALQAASQWVVKLSDTECDSATYTAIEAWYHSRPEHAAAFDRLSKVWGTLGRLQPDQLNARPRRATRALAGGLLSVALLAGLIGGPAFDAPDVRADHRVERVALPDGSIATLDAGSALRFDYAAGRRDVVLERGRALFEVRPRQAGEPPFRVRTDQGIATALGTRFEVTRAASGMRVHVYEHDVAILCTVCEPREAMTLSPGEGAHLHDGKWQRDAGATTASPAWSQGLLRLDDISLAQAAERLQPYSDRRLLVVGAARDLRVSGTVNIADVQRALRFLLARQSVTTYTLPGLLVLQ